MQRGTRAPRRRTRPRSGITHAGAAPLGGWRGIALALPAALLLAGCAQMYEDVVGEPDPLGPDAQVSTGTNAEEEGYPSLGQVPDKPARRPSGQQNRQQLRDTLASDRANARYSDERLQGEGVEAADDGGAAMPEAPEPPGISDGATAADGSGTATSDTGTSAAGTGTAGSSGELADGESLSVGEAGAASVSGASNAGNTGSSSGSTGGASDGSGDAMRGATELTASQGQRSSDRSGNRSSTATTDSASTGSARTDGASAAGRTASGTAPSGAQEQVPSDVPQMQQSQQGEPIRVPDMPDFARSEARAPAGGGSSGETRARPTQQAQATTGDANVVTPPQPGAEAGQSRTFAAGDPAQTAGEVPGRRVAVIYFGHGSTGLDGDDREVLGQVARLAKQRDAAVRVIGHSSSRTAPMGLIEHRMANFDTSLKRAEAVADTLASMGVPRERIKVEGRADRDPVYHEFMPTGEAGNRRTEVFLGG